MEFISCLLEEVQWQSTYSYAYLKRLKKLSQETFLQEFLLYRSYQAKQIWFIPLCVEQGREAEVDKGIWAIRGFLSECTSQLAAKLSAPGSSCGCWKAWAA